MSTPGSWEWLLWLLSILATAVLVGKLVRNGLHRKYRSFSIYLCAELVRSLILLPIPTNRTLYAYIYLSFEPVLWVLYVMVVLELSNLVLQRHPGIVSLSRWLISGGLGLALAISLLGLQFDYANSAERFPILLLFYVMRRAIMFALVLLLLLLTAFLLWYPVPLNRNIAIYFAGYACYFLSNSMALVMRNVFGHEMNRFASTLMLGITNLSLLIWIVGIRRQGETTPATLGHRWRPEEAERLLGQLRAFNSSLDRTTKTAGLPDKFQQP